MKPFVCHFKGQTPWLIAKKWDRSEGGEAWEITAKGNEKKDLPEDLLKMFCKFPPWSLGIVLQRHIRNRCPDTARWGCGSSVCQRFLLCLLSSPRGQWQGPKMTPFTFFFFGHFHFILLLWSDSLAEELGSFSSSCCINECKTRTIFLWRDSLIQGRNPSWTIILRKINQTRHAQFRVLLREDVRKLFATVSGYQLTNFYLYRWWFHL